MPMTLENFVKTRPQLYHMAESGSWESIRRHGLLSTEALLDLFQIDGDRKETLLSRNRAQCVPIDHPTFGHAVIRDNNPLNDKRLARCLTDMTLEEWYRLLNGKVFFWATRKRLEKLLAAKAYRNRSHSVITVDAESLLRECGPNTTLCHFNSGATAPYRDVARGRGTFSSIAEWPLVPSSVVEVAIQYCVPARIIESCAVKVEEIQAGGQSSTLWQAGA